ncbi:MAG: hypothetical protein GY854_28380 [Deltaproteobacteria bacterium]|nr:hypothetical protein [Deltaproteobacteria bacterium]
METRVFRARSMSDALRQTRRSLGADALILSARTLDDKSGFVEVTAAGQEKVRDKPMSKEDNTGEAAPSQPVDPEPWLKTIAPLREEISSLRRMVRELRAVADQAILPGFNDLRTLILESSREQEAGRLLGPLYSELIDRGVMPDLARDLVRAVEIELGLKDLDRRDWLTLARGLLRDLLGKQIQVAGPLVPGDGVRIFSFIGPSGVGKTTTLAKIASRMALSEGLDIVMVTTDTYRIGSVDQARRYAELIGVPLVVADRPETMASALRTYAGVDALLVDTPGRAFENNDVRRALSTILSAADEPIEDHLIISATHSPAQQAAIGQRFNEFGPCRLVVTKIDEATQPGGLLNAAKLTSLPVSYLTDGQRVPEDIEVATTSRLIQILLGSGE